MYHEQPLTLSILLHLHVHVSNLLYLVNIPDSLKKYKNKTDEIICFYIEKKFNSPYFQIPSA